MNTFEMVRVTEHVNGPTASTYDWSLPPGMQLQPKLDLATGLDKLTEDGTLDLITVTSVGIGRSGSAGTDICHTIFFKHVETKKPPKPGAAWSK
jgi:hypothetical protein